MTYSSGGLIQAADYNGFASLGSPSVNTFWASGTGSSGYGQTPINTVLIDRTVYATEWASLFLAIKKAAAHQGVTLLPFYNTSPLPGEIITFEQEMISNINALYANRLNTAAQGSSLATSVVNTNITWSSSLTMEITATFASENAARYYFNAGGQIGFSFYHPSTGVNINQTFTTIAGQFGTVWLSSPTSGAVTLSGSSYNGVTQVGGVTSGATINTNLGFYGLTSSNQQLAKHNASTEYSVASYSNSYISINARSTGSGVIVFTILWDLIPDGYTMTQGSTTTITLRPPSTKYLANTWGIPTLTYSMYGT